MTSLLTRQNHIHTTAVMMTKFQRIFYVVMVLRKYPSAIPSQYTFLLNSEQKCCRYLSGEVDGFFKMSEGLAGEAFSSTQSSHFMSSHLLFSSLITTSSCDPVYNDYLKLHACRDLDVRIAVRCSPHHTDTQGMAEMKGIAEEMCRGMSIRCTKYLAQSLCCVLLQYR